MMFERRLSFHIDWALVAAVLSLCAIGLVMIYSTTYGQDAAGPQFWTQLYALALGVLALVICLSIDYRALAEHSLLVYGLFCASLFYVMFFGLVRGGARRWIDLGVFNLQPSEFGRIVVALILAMYFGENRRGARTTADLLLGAVLVSVPFLLIVRQPDLGTAATLLPVFVGIAYVAGMRMRLLAVAALIAVLLAPVAWTYALQGYQKERITTFINPERDPRGAGYQQIQARVTVGSGGLTGKGFRDGTQGQYKFLPVAHNDFIFSVLAEEWGFIGVLVALGLYLFVGTPQLRGGAAGQGPARRVPCRGHHVRVRVPGHLQHHHVGRAGAREGADAAVDELRRVGRHRHAGRVRPHPERQDAAVYELRRRS